MGRAVRAGKILDGGRSLSPVTFQPALEIVPLHAMVPAIDRVHQIVQSHGQVKGDVNSVDGRG